MGQASTGYITLSNYGVGRVSIDPAMVRGEGGAHDARLVIPVSIEMASQPAERQLALTRLSGALHLDQPDLPGFRIGLPDTVDITYNMPCRSFPEGSVPHIVELRFPLGLPLIERIERHRHANSEHEAVLYLHLEGTVVWLHTTHGNSADSPRAEAGRDVAARFALHSEMSTFWLPRIDHLRIAIDQAQWIRNVLSDVGYDRVRLVEFTLPPTLPDAVNADVLFAGLLRAFDSGRSEDAVAATRGVFAAWRTYLSATRQKPVASTVADRLQWQATDPRREFLGKLWKSATDFANVPHHPEGQTVPFKPTASDARLQLMLAIVLSDYVADVLGLGKEGR
jgi:hypothetical protein